MTDWKKGVHSDTMSLLLLHKWYKPIQWYKTIIQNTIYRALIQKILGRPIAQPPAIFQAFEE
jgi:hypothetical protein